MVDGRKLIALEKKVLKKMYKLINDINSDEWRIRTNSVLISRKLNNKIKINSRLQWVSHVWRNQNTFLQKMVPGEN